MDPSEYKRRVDAERGVGTIRSKIGPWLLPCCWTECDRPARRETLFAEPPDGHANIRFYFFCSMRHRAFWVASVTNMGNLPTGSRGLLT